jgi:hypothetical protein
MPVIPTIKEVETSKIITVQGHSGEGGAEQDSISISKPDVMAYSCNFNYVGSVTGKTMV